MTEQHEQGNAPRAGGADAGTPGAGEADRVDAAARAWMLRLASGAATEEDLAAFEAWCEADPSHRSAFEEVRDLWDDIGELRAAFAGTGTTEDTVVEPASRRTWRRRAVLGGLVAASLAFLAAIGADVPTRLLADHRTDIGEQARIPLPDGSTAYLNTDSAVVVDYSGDRRRLTLLRGEAFFEVSPDRTRPFAVAARGGRITAVGTAFAVREAGGPVTVTVTEGRVRVASPATDGEEGVLVGAGQRTRYDDAAGPEPAQPADPGAALAWRRGEVAFSGVPLDTAMTEIDRYLPGRILLADTAQEPVTARLSLGALDDGIMALAATHGLTATRLTDYLLIVR